MARRMLLTFGACAAIVFALRAARSSLFPVEVSGKSMLPALEPGDFVLVRRSIPSALAGQIVYLLGPDGRPLLKRIVGLPGESLRVGGHVEVNGRVLAEPYARGASPVHQHRGVNQLADDECFVLGDNREASTDSRDFGPVRVADIQGVAWVRYWPPRRFGRLSPTRRRLEDPVAHQHTGGDAPLAAAVDRIPLRDATQFGTTS